MSRKSNAARMAVNMPEMAAKPMMSILEKPKQKLSKLFVILVLGLVAATTVLSFIANGPSRNTPPVSISQPVVTQATTTQNGQSVDQQNIVVK
jgi:hypothetical protein